MQCTAQHKNMKILGPSGATLFMFRLRLGLWLWLRPRLFSDRCHLFHFVRMRHGPSSSSFSLANSCARIFSSFLFDCSFAVAFVCGRRMDLDYDCLFAFPFRADIASHISMQNYANEEHRFDKLKHSCCSLVATTDESSHRGRMQNHPDRCNALISQFN